jgi:NADH-quinone oxidoreductase subunit N
MSPVSGNDLLSIAPQLIIGGFGMLVLLMDALWPKISKRLVANLSVLGLIIAGVVTCVRWPKGTVAPTMQGMVMPDGYTAFFTLVLVIGSALSIWLSVEYLERQGRDHGEYYALILFTTLGGMVMAASVNLICIFIGLEILSISLYILAGYRADRIESDESAMKYFLLGAFASAFFVYGVALVYGATGSLNIQKIADALQNASQFGLQPGKNYLLLAGIAMMLVGFAFKVAVVPFHIWTPDVYEGAPTSVTAFMSVAAKTAGFAAFLRVMAGAFKDPGVQVQISAVLASIAALTMLVGNVVAVVQPNIKRMLAYSSIAHAGYILTGLVAAVRPPGGLGSTPDAQVPAISAVLFYTLAYTVSNLGAFGVVLALRRKGEEVVDIRDFAGIGYRYPALGVIMTICLLSLAGLPPTAGFFGKIFLMNSLVGLLQQDQRLLWLVILFALTSVVSFYYYLGVVRAMYMDRIGADAGEGTTLAADWHLKLALGLCAIATVALGLWSGSALSLAQGVAATFLGGGPTSAMR